VKLGSNRGALASNDRLAHGHSLIDFVVHRHEGLWRLAKSTQADIGLRDPARQLILWNPTLKLDIGQAFLLHKAFSASPFGTFSDHHE